jgi:hypothetical protein
MLKTEKYIRDSKLLLTLRQEKLTKEVGKNGKKRGTMAGEKGEQTCRKVHKH